MRVVVATGNRDKLREFAEILGATPLDLISQASLGVESPPETGATFLDNALIKARHASRVTGLPAIADDSGLEVDALDGAPGVYSARYAGERASDAANNAKLLAAVRDVPDGQRGARYRCVVVLLRSAADAKPLVGHGSWEGSIARVPRGAGGFGYDPLFVVSGQAHTAGELDAAAKHAQSHRGQALRALFAQL